MKKKIIISGTSFLNPEHTSWKKILKSYSVEFLSYGNFANALFSEKDYSVSIIVIYLQDLIEVNEKFDKAKKKLLPFLNLIKARVQSSNIKTIIAISKGSSEHKIKNAKTFSDIYYTFNWLIFKIEKIAKKTENLFQLNLDEVFSDYGNNKIFDNRNWYFAHCRYSSLGLKVIANSIKAILDRIYFPIHKLLVLDCDNTIWGGVVAEDGIENIVLGTDGIGCAYIDFQKEVKNLCSKGIMIALASKNNQQDVIKVFKNHKSMILNLNDIVAYKINWADKSKNLISLSKDLGINTDSFIFWDDNPLERDKMRITLPDVNTVEPPENIFDWPNYLKNMNEFSQFCNTKEDKAKLTQYRNRAKFIHDLSTVKDDFSYLKSISLKANTINLDKSNVSRAVQLCQKTNQFNLRTSRHSSKELFDLVKENNAFCTLTKLKDQYGDHGIVGLFCLKQIDEKNIFLDTFLVSCRVLGRHFEVWMLYKALKIAKRNGFTNLIGEYIPTEKNILVKDFLRKHNFKELKGQYIEVLRQSNFKLNNNSKFYIKNTKETGSPVLDLYG